MISETLSIDEKDVKIISTFMQNPEVSQTELAEKLKISQPSVNARIHKLKNRGILAFASGIEFNRAKLYLATVHFTAANADEVLDKLKHCPHFINGFVMSGKHNVCIMVAAHALKKIETIINTHLRNNNEVSDISMSVVISSAKPFVFQMDIIGANSESCKDVNSCNCEHIKKK